MMGRHSNMKLCIKICNKGKFGKNIKSVHNGKTFKCYICPSNFTDKGNLKKHVESVYKGKTFKCEICPSKFATKGNLKNISNPFMKEKHLNVTFFIQSLQIKVI